MRRCWGAGLRMARNSAEGSGKKLPWPGQFSELPPLTILDEPTAGLDPPSEALFIDNLRDLAGGRSLLLVSHKIAAARQADRIYVMRSGRVIEQGDHEQLLEQRGATTAGCIIPS